MINNLDEYKLLNKKAEKHSVVFFGADWLYDIPVAELARDNGIDTAVYNRSLRGLSLKDSEKIIDECICDLSPDKVFINIGENDISDSFDADEFAEKFEWLLYTVNAKCRCRIYILSIVNDSQGANEIIKKIAEKYGCEYIDIRNCCKSAVEFFAKIRFFLRQHRITFCEAMRI